MDDTEARPSGAGGIAARTITARDGRVLVFSCDQFVEDICSGDCCFICGAAPGSKPFNGEHVLPRWLLKRFNLFDKKITLADGRPRTYGQYRMPCCVACNSLLGDEVETPVSQLLSGGYTEIMGRLDGENVRLLFVWLCLLFLKTHLKDCSVPENSNPLLNEGWLGEIYSWPDMHHLQCVARAPYTGAEIEPAVLGSMQFFQVSDEAVKETFDYGDLTRQQTVWVRVGDFAVAAVLNDSGASQIAWSMVWPEITGPVSTVQLREAASLLATANSDLLNRPTFGTAYSRRDDTIRLYAEHEGMPRFAKFDPVKFGETFALAVRDHIPRVSVDGEKDAAKVEELIRTGRARFLLDRKGRFRPAQVVWEAVPE